VPHAEGSTAFELAPVLVAKVENFLVTSRLRQAGHHDRFVAQNELLERAPTACADVLVDRHERTIPRVAMA
jgi:hypothetical protein